MVTQASLWTWQWPDMAMARAGLGTRLQRLCNRGLQAVQVPRQRAKAAKGQRRLDPRRVAHLQGGIAGVMSVHMKPKHASNGAR